MTEPTSLKQFLKYNKHSSEVKCGTAWVRDSQELQLIPVKVMAPLIFHFPNENGALQNNEPQHIHQQT